uniref:Uncharacterized protein n=1 Tax=Parascaris equorum TaxID=6256 RepID=A0A914S349_PAREQ
MTALGVSDLTDPRLARNIFCEPGTADASEPFRQVSF